MAVQIQTLDSLRADFPLLRDVTYLQTGSHAPLSRRVQEAMGRAQEIEGTSGVSGKWGTKALHEESEQVRTRFAGFLGVTAKELGWANNTTTAIRYAISSLTWQTGDAILWSSAEHASSRQLQQALAQRRGVRNIILPVEQGDERFLSELETALQREDKARLLFLSHVSCQDGRRLPVREATHLAHSHNVPVLVDGAQAVGQFPFNIGELGCDFYAGSAHKWVFGPAGLGFLVVARGRLGSFYPDFAMAPQDAKCYVGWNDPDSVGGRIEQGTLSVAPRAGLDAMLHRLQAIGLVTIERYVADLSAYLRSGLQALPGVSILTPRGEDQSSGITTITLPDRCLEEANRVVMGLWETRRVVTKVQPEYPGIRVSVAAFNTMEDIERLLDGLAALQ